MENKSKQKKEKFVQFVRKSENFWELIKRRPSAFVLLSIVAMRAKRTDSTNFNDLEVGEAYIGDYKNYGSTEQKYRTDKKFLETHKFLTTKSTTKGTVAKLIDKTIFDINEGKLTNKLTNSQRTPNERLTTNKNDKNDNNVKELEYNSLTENEQAQKVEEVKDVKEIETTKQPVRKKQTREDISLMLSYLRSRIGIESFVDSAMERNFGKHIIGLVGKIGKDEFLRRLDCLLEDDFHRKNCNKIKYVYNNIKGFIEPTIDISKYTFN